jgi:hypothetical protein
MGAHAEDRARWQALYFNDRILIRMDPGWTQFEKTYFSAPSSGHHRRERRAGNALSRWPVLARKWTRSRERK